MEWRALEEHFRAATTQAPAPFGDDAIEWDYSRYSRALGLTGQPGLDDLQHTGSAVLALPGRRWEPAARKYEGWAGQQDWSLVRLSARPTVMVPDPVVHGLGVALAGRDGLIFARSGRQGPPALGARPRPAGMSIPLTPGERWLIATAHVRRRLRNEMAVRGLVLFIEEAHRLTPAALALLAHVIRAHRAWQARMLARDAKAYVVFVTTPDHKAEMLAMLERFDIQGPPPVRRDRIRKDAPSVPQPVLTVEQEHLLSALAAAPLALTESDIATLFGSSAAAAARDLVERDVLQVRVEAGERCFVPRVAHLDDLSDPPPRVLQALHDHYRKRLKRGHQHLRFAAAAIAARLGQPLRAAAHIHRASPADTATLPFDTYQELRRTLTSVKNRLHASHLGTWIAMHAHQRQYDRAKGLATDLTQTDIRTAREFYRVLVQILCMGRTHTDQAIPEDFWPGLKSKTLDASLVDAVCIFSELFARLRMMKPAEILQRYEFAEECLSASRPPVGHTSLVHLVEMVRYRVAVSLRAHFYPHLLLPSFCGGSTTPRRLALEREIPAYVTATLAYAETLGRNHSDAPNFDRSDRSMGVDLVRCTGNPCDSRIQLGGWFAQLRIHGCGLIVRELADDILLLLAQNAPQQQRHVLALQFQGLAGGRAWLLGANSLLRQGPPQKGHRAACKLEVAYASQALLYAGDFAGARDVLDAQIESGARWGHALALLIQSHILLARKTLQWHGFENVSQLITQHRAKLPESLLRFSELFLQGSELLCSGELHESESCFRTARLSLGRVVPGEVGALYVSALRSELSTRYLRSALAGHSSGQKSLDVSAVVRRLLSYHRANGGFAYEASSVGAILDYIVVCLELWVGAAGRSQVLSPITLALSLRQAIEPALRSMSDDTVCALSRTAPAFFRVLRSHLQETVGQLIPSDASTRAIGSALGVIDTLWSDTETGKGATDFLPDPLGTYDVHVVPSQSRVRQARRHLRHWQEDAAVYAHTLRATMKDHHSPGQKIEAFGYLFGEESPPAKVIVDVRINRERMDNYTVRLQAPRSQLGFSAGASSHTVGRRGVASRVGALKNGDTGAGFEGSSRAAEQVRQMIEVAAGCDYPVLVIGDTGVGKEVVARCIHARSTRSRGELVVADCGVTTDSLLESELFGHKKGAFTGADADHIGFVERSNGSTLFLDEVDSMSARMQASLLRVLENGDYRPVGENAHRRSDFRLIAAAMPRLMQLVDEQQFRQDLFYRMSALRIHVPALADRDGDAAELARSYAGKLGFVLSPDAMREIGDYAWPGNVRQLRHCIEVASLSAFNGFIDGPAVAQSIDAYRGTAGGTSSLKPRDAADAALMRASRALGGMPHFGAWEFARASGVSRRSAQRHLARLLRLGHLVRLGAGRATRYKIRARAQIL